MATVRSLGIDLGTTTSCMASMKNRRVEVLENREGRRVTPSVVCYDAKGAAPVVGDNAIIHAATQPENFIYEVKRMFGKGFSHPDMVRAIPNWSFKVKMIKTNAAASAEVTDNIGIIVNENGQEKVYEPIQVSAAVLNYLLESAKPRLGGYPSNVVITVPAYFHDGAKKRTIDAATIAFAGKKDGDTPVNIQTTLLAEPTAAAIAYGITRLNSGAVAPGAEECILVFDLGGGTYDVSILTFSYDPENPVGIVRATDGDNFLGGSDLDNVIMAMARRQAGARNYDSLSETDKKKNDLRLRQEAIKVKAALSTSPSVTFNLSCYCGTDDLIFEITQSQFEREARSIFNRILERCQGVLLSYKKITPVYTDAGMLDMKETAMRNNVSEGSLRTKIEEAKAEIDRVVMVGGSSRVPKVIRILEDFFGDKPGMDEAKKRVVAPLNQDEAVAYGAAYYANATSGAMDDEAGPNLLLIDQVPLNLNIETAGGVATPVIEARTAVPCQRTQTFSTAADNQEQVDIVVTQGNRARSADNHCVGRFVLSGIQRAPRGVPQIEITFSVDQNNVLTVAAADKATGSKQEMKVTNMSSNLSSEDIERMKKQAEEHAAQDAIFRETAQLKSQFESTVFAFRDQAEQNCPEPTKTEVLKRCDDQVDWLRGDHSLEELKAAMSTFTSEVAAMLPKNGPGAAPSEANSPDVEEVN